MAINVIADEEVRMPSNIAGVSGRIQPLAQHLLFPARMGLFRSLFTKVDPRDELIQRGMALLKEMERVYRNQLELTPARGVPKGVGLLKARLLSATFVHAAFQSSARRSEADLEQFCNLCSGIAMEPFAEPHFTPSIKRKEAMTFAWAFMMKVLAHIHEELAGGPSNSRHKTDGFEHLVNMYHHCLAESFSQGAYSQAVRRELSDVVESVIWTHFRALGEQIAAIR